MTSVPWDFNLFWRPTLQENHLYIYLYWQSNTIIKVSLLSPNTSSTQNTFFKIWNQFSFYPQHHLFNKIIWPGFCLSIQKKEPSFNFNKFTTSEQQMLLISTKLWMYTLWRVFCPLLFVPPLLIPLEVFLQSMYFLDSLLFSNFCAQFSFQGISVNWQFLCRTTKSPWYTWHS